MDELKAVEDWAGALLARLDPSARRRVTAAIARDFRRSQQARIAAQRNPDGQAFEARKKSRPKGKKALRDKKGRIKRNAMFVQLRTARFLKTESDAAGLAIGFAGRIARLASVHQFGENAPVRKNGPSYKYPARVLLGLNDADRELIGDRVLAHLAA